MPHHNIPGNVVFVSLGDSPEKIVAEEQGEKFSAHSGTQRSIRRSSSAVVVLRKFVSPN